MSEERTCEHGWELGKSHLPDGPFMGGISKCGCCLGFFGYIDSGMYTHSRQETVTNDKGRCPRCGGKANRRVVENGIVIEDVDLRVN